MDWRLLFSNESPLSSLGTGNPLMSGVLYLRRGPLLVLAAPIDEKVRVRLRGPFDSCLRGCVHSETARPTFGSRGKFLLSDRELSYFRRTKRRPNLNFADQFC